MNRVTKCLGGLMICCVSLVGAANIASAGPNYHQYGGAGVELSPEMQTAMQQASATMAPLQMQLHAKQSELTAKIYSGADDKEIQALSKEIDALHAQVLQARINNQKTMAKVGVPMGNGGYGHRGGGCGGGYGGGYGGGHGGGYGGGHGGGHR